MPLRNDVFPSADVLVSLGPREVGMFILKRLCESGEEHVSRGDFTGDEHLSHVVPGFSRDDRRLARVMMEGWVWLERELLIAPRPGIQSQSFFVTQQGKEASKLANLEAYLKSYRILRDDLDTVLASKVKPLFMRGDYATAVFEAFKEVEIRVREKGTYPLDKIGTDLMRAAFNSDRGPLTDMTVPVAEREATAALFAGAMGLFKNPESHRDVSLNDLNEAEELILFANHLLRVVSRRETKRAP